MMKLNATFEPLERIRPGWESIISLIDQGVQNRWTFLEVRRLASAALTDYKRAMRAWAKARNTLAEPPKVGDRGDLVMSELRNIQPLALHRQVDPSDPLHTGRCRVIPPTAPVLQYPVEFHLHPRHGLIQPPDVAASCRATPPSANGGPSKCPPQPAKPTAPPPSSTSPTPRESAVLRHLNPPHSPRHRAADAPHASLVQIHARPSLQLPPHHVYLALPFQPLPSGLAERWAAAKLRTVLNRHQTPELTILDRRTI
jgi:hypothetical protein